jgi:hypothetical protein
MILNGMGLYFEAETEQDMNSGSEDSGETAVLSN